MALGDNLSFLDQKNLATRLAYHLNNDANLTSWAGLTTKSLQNWPLVCSKTLDPAPADDTDEDMPPSLGFFCLHYNAAGVFQSLYVAVSGTLAASGTCNWVAVSSS